MIYQITLYSSVQFISVYLATVHIKTDCAGCLVKLKENSTKFNFDLHISKRFVFAADNERSALLCIGYLLSDI